MAAVTQKIVRRCEQLVSQGAPQRVVAAALGISRYTVTLIANGSYKANVENREASRQAYRELFGPVSHERVIKKARLAAMGKRFTELDPAELMPQLEGEELARMQECRARGMSGVQS